MDGEQFFKGKFALGDLFGTIWIQYVFNIMKKSFVIGIAAFVLAGGILASSELWGGMIFASVFQAEDPTAEQITQSGLTPGEIQITGEPGAREFVLAREKSGNDRFIVPEKTCENGVRMFFYPKANAVLTRKPSVIVRGVSSEKSRSTFSRTVTLEPETPHQLLHLPSAQLDESDTIFSAYQIAESKWSGDILYDVTCY